MAKPGAKPTLSVILPVYNAMPWLPTTVRDVLSQRLQDDASLELLATFDGGDDGSLDFLLRLAAELGASRATDELVEPTTAAAASNPALLQPLRAPETADHPSFASAEAPEGAATPLSVAQVAAACRPEHRLRVLRHVDGANRGQGHAMSLALRHARAGLVAQMESDDERPRPDAFARMLAELAAHAEWDGVSCVVALVGWERPGMEEYVAWQNSLLTPERMAAGRFVEIPALHQTAIFRREAVEEVLATSGGRYRDGPRRDAGAPGGGGGADIEAAGGAASPPPSAAASAATGAEAAAAAAGDELDTPVDLWWWLAFFHGGKRCGKLGGEPLFGWRQHPRQHTRTHGRLSLDNLRRVKAHFLVRPGGPAHGAARVEVWSTGQTLHGWAADLRAAQQAVQGPAGGGGGAVCEVRAVEWKPGAPPPPHWPRPPPKPKKRKAAAAAAAAAVAATADAAVPNADAAAAAPAAAAALGGGRQGVVRLFAFGMHKARQKARAHVHDWDDRLDWFVA